MNATTYCRQVYSLEKVLVVDKVYEVTSSVSQDIPIPRIQNVQLDLLLPKLQERGLNVVEKWSSKLVMQGNDLGRGVKVALDTDVAAENLRGYELVGITSRGEIEICFIPFVQAEHYMPLWSFWGLGFIRGRVYCREGIECRVQYRGDEQRLQEMRGVVDLLQDMYSLKEQK